MYLNTSDFSSNAYGIKVAAETYFGKQPDSLNLQESAVLGWHAAGTIILQSEKKSKQCAIKAE